MDIPQYHQSEIVIAGASLAGLTLALSLVHHGTSTPQDILILESRARDAAPGGPVLLTPNSLRILDKLGLYSRLRGRGYNFSTGTFRDAKGCLMGAPVPYGGKEEWGFEALRIERCIVLDVLRQEVETRGIKIKYRHSLRSILSEDEDGVTISVRHHGKCAKGLQCRTPILVGCDGLHSRVRGWAVGREVDPIYNGITMVAAKADRYKLRYGTDFADAERNEEFCLGISTSKGAMISIPAEPSGTPVLVGRQFVMPERDREGWETFNADKQALLHLFTNDIDEWPSDLCRSMLEHAKPEDMYIWAIYSLPKLERYVSEKGRVAVIGDAAHTLIPAAGQGANMAFEDAWTLAPHLTGADVAGLEKWQRARIDRIEQVAKLSVQLLNVRLPPEEQAKLPKDHVFDLSGGDEGQSGRLRWLFGFGTE